MTVAPLSPITFSVDAASAFILSAGGYHGGMYGGSTASILLNTPASRRRSSPRSKVTGWPGPEVARKRLRRPPSLFRG
jgi:TctA family transporter